MPKGIGYNVDPKKVRAALAVAQNSSNEDIKKKVSSVLGNKRNMRSLANMLVHGK